MTEIVREIRIAMRGMARDKTFALPVLLTLVVCIAANAAVFSVVHSVLLAPLPVPEPERLVWVANSYPKAGVEEADNGVPDYFDRREHVAAFEEVAIYRDVGRTLGTKDGAERISGKAATPSLFRILGTSAARGRVLEERDAEPGQDQQIVLSWGLAQRLYGGADAAIGKELRVSGDPHSVVGVLPNDFTFVDAEAQFWLPLAFTAEDRADDKRHSNSFQMIARLRDGATLEQAREQILAINAANLERSPGLRQILLDAGFTTKAGYFQERIVRDVRDTLHLLWGGVLFVLLIGCVNVANLALVRATTRAREVAARQSLGAGPWRLLRQLVLESLVLTTTAGLLGTALAYLAVRSFAAAAAERVPRGSEIALGGTTLLLVVGLTAGLTLLLALIPMLRNARVPLARTLREEGRAGTASRASRSVRRTLVAVQVAFAFVLVLGAALMLASFRELLRVDTGFRAEGVITGKVALTTTSYPDEATLRTGIDRMLERVRALPGVVAAGFGDTVPLTDSYNDSVILAEGFEPKPGESVVSPANTVVTPGYFDALGIELVSGRYLDARDTPTSQAVVVIDEGMAKHFFPGLDPLGRRMYQPNSPEEVGKPGPDTRYVTIVGVVASVKQRGLASADERIGAYYYPVTQSSRRQLTLVARTTGDPSALATDIRREIAALDPELPLYDVHTMAERVDRSVAGQRAAMTLASCFGAVALLLSALGIYGVLAYQVTQRTREIGIRMALGSESGRVFKLVVGEGAALLAIGLALGFAGLYGVRTVLAKQLYGITPFDPVVLGTVTALLALVALVACLVPARRAAKIDPLVALAD
jgi:predicted permease